jgi:hypothetical protein
MATHPLPRFVVSTRLLAFLMFIAVPAGISFAGTNGDAVIAAEKARNVALVAGDVKALTDILSDDLRYIHSNGKLETKQIVLETIASKKTAYEWMRTSDLVADEVTPNVVVLSGKIDQRKLGGAGWAELVLLFQAVWRNESGTWRLANLQTALPPPTAK